MACGGRYTRARNLSAESCCSTFSPYADFGQHPAAATPRCARPTRRNRAEQRSGHTESGGRDGDARGDAGACPAELVETASARGRRHVAGCRNWWWLLTSFQAKPSETHTSAWLGTVTSAPSTPSASNGNAVCVRPLPGDPSGTVDGKPWCGSASPSRGLEFDDLTIGASVRVVTFITPDKDGTDVSGVLFLPSDLPNPPAA